MKRTYQPKKKDIEREWHLVDVKGKILGRVASEIAGLLIGKHKVEYVPHLDMGDQVVVVNAKDLKVTGRKMKQKIYYRHSGYPQGFRELTLEQMMEKDPTKVIELAVKRMLPKNRLQDPRMRRLRVFAGEEHDYEDKFKKSNKKNNTKANNKARKGKTKKDSNKKKIKKTNKNNENKNKKESKKGGSK